MLPRRLLSEEQLTSLEARGPLTKASALMPLLLRKLFQRQAGTTVTGGTAIVSSNGERGRVNCSRADTVARQQAKMEVFRRYPLSGQATQTDTVEM